MLTVDIVHIVFLLIVCVQQIKCTAFVVNFSDQVCGKQSPKLARIVNGEETVPGEFPWVVSIRHRSNHMCGGVVVNKRWVVTAAHCFCGEPLLDRKEKFEVAIIRDGFRNNSSQNLRIAELNIHPEYSCSRLENDIALLKVQTQILWTNADPACFPTNKSLFTNLSNMKAIAVGWGATNENFNLGQIPWLLRKVQLPILTNTECQQWYLSQNRSLLLHKTQLCAGYKHGKRDTCWADSGGPLMVKNGVHMVVVGIVSTGIGCARPSLPGIYTRLTEYVNWMARMIS